MPVDREPKEMSLIVYDSVEEELSERPNAKYVDVEVLNAPANTAAPIFVLPLAVKPAAVVKPVEAEVVVKGAVVPLLLFWVKGETVRPLNELDVGVPWGWPAGLKFQ